MEITVNKPLAETFGWLQAGAKRIDLQDKIQNISYVLGPGESRVLFLEDPGASEYEITLGEGARLDLVQLREASGKDLSYNNVRVTCGDKAYFGWYRVVLGGAESYDNCSVTLAGKESSFAANVCYRLDGTEKYDLNCEAIHTGKRTESAISASGVLADRASKLMRGTIDFRTGCSGSVGNETEDASIGRPDEDMLFYMETRGVDEETACEMLARAKIDSVIRKIPDESIREKIWARVQRGE